MKTAQDFRRALGPADPGFERAMDQALSRLQKEEKPVKKKMSLSLVLALVLLTLTLGTALAPRRTVGNMLAKTPPTRNKQRRSVQTAAHFFAIKFCVRAYSAMPFLKKNSI